MSYSRAQSRRSIDPHGYQPLVIDEDVLNAGDRIEAIEAAGNRRRNWTRYLTRSEVRSFEKAIKEIKQSRSPYWLGPEELPAVRDKRFEMVRLGILRAHARDKYANGQRIWYGDGVPFKRHI